MTNTLVNMMDYDSILNNLYTISEIDRLYSGEQTSEYYYLYEENAIEISTIASEVLNQITDEPLYRLCKPFTDQRSGWNDVIATMEGTDYFTMCEITGADPMTYSRWEHDVTVQKYREKLKRYTKDSLFELVSWVSSSLMRYMEVRAAYDAIYSVVAELERHNSFISNDGTVAPPAAAWDM